MLAVKCDWCGDIHPEHKSVCWAFDYVFPRDEAMTYIELGVRVWHEWYDKHGQVLITYSEAS